MVSDNRRFTVPGCTAVAITFSAAIQPTSACEDLTVRDAAFTEPRDVHLLCVIANSDDVNANQTYDRLSTWQSGTAAFFNLSVVRVRADDPEVRWESYGIPSAPPQMPVVALIGRQQAHDRTFYITHWEPGPTDDELAALLSSPARQTIRDRVINHIAVLLYVPGTEPGAGDAESLLDTVAKRYVDRGLEGVSVLRIGRTDPNERLLLSFAGVPPTGPDWVGVVFGRGKFMTPLQGANITDSTLTDVIEQVAAECTCVQTAGRMGVDIPMQWDEALDETVLALVGTGTPGELLAAASLEAKPAPAIDMPLTPTASILPEVNETDASAPASIGTLMRNTLLALGALLIVTMIGTVATVRRRNRKPIRPVTG